MLAEFVTEPKGQGEYKKKESKVEENTTEIKPPVKIEAKPEPKERKDFKSFFAKVKKVKNFEIYLAVGLILIMIAIYMSTLGGGGSPTSPQNVARANENFAREMEQRLVATLSNVRGAGSVSAMVTVVGTATIEIAYNIDERTVTQTAPGGSSTTNTTITKTPIIVGGQPVIIHKINPRVMGVVIVASGAHDPMVRMNLLRAVQVVIADDSVRIEIFAGR